MSSKDFAYYVKDLTEDDQKALKLSSPNKWLDFNTAFINCLGQLGLLSDSGDTDNPVEERPQPHVIDTDDPNDYKKSTIADALLKTWSRRQQQKYAILTKLTRGCPHFELRWLKVQEYAAEGTIDLIQVGTKWQIADALTKWLPRTRFEFLRGYLLGTSMFDHSKYPTRSH